MLTTIEQIVNNIPVIQTSLAYESKTSKQAARFAWSTGGFFAVRIANEGVETWLETMGFNVRETVKQKFREMKTPHFICIVDEFFQHMTEKQVHAVLLHEYAHILHGDFEKYTPTPGKVELKIDIQDEIQADAYAASIVGKDAMRDALLRMLEIQWKLEHPKNPYAAKMMVWITKHLTCHRKRFAALA